MKYFFSWAQFYKIWTESSFGQFFENDSLNEPKKIPSSKNFYLFRKMVKNAKWWSKLNLPLSVSPTANIFPFKKRFFKWPKWQCPLFMYWLVHPVKLKLHGSAMLLFNFIVAKKRFYFFQTALFIRTKKLHDLQRPDKLGQICCDVS